jgi:hypothetical protein
MQKNLNSKKYLKCIMDKIFIMIISLALIITSTTGCKKKKEPEMVDMDIIKTDGSYDDKYIFRRQIEKEESRGKKYKKKEF